MELVVKNPPTNAWDSGDAGSILSLGRSPGGGNGNPLQYSCLDNPTDREAWWATVHRITNRNTKNVFSWSCLWYFIFDLYHFFLYFSFKIVPKIHFKVNHSFFWSTVFSFLIYNAFINFHVVFNLLKIFFTFTVLMPNFLSSEKAGPLLNSLITFFSHFY